MEMPRRLQAAKLYKIRRLMKRIAGLLTLFLAMTTVACKSDKKVGENPFFSAWETPYGVPPFDRILPEHFLPAIERGMSLHDAEIDAIVTNRDEPTFENVILAFDNSGQMLAQTSLVFGMLCAAQNTPEMQALQEQAMPRLTAHYDKILLNDALFERVKAVYDNPGDVRPRRRAEPPAGEDLPFVRARRSAARCRREGPAGGDQRRTGPRFGEVRQQPAG